jgi:CHAD domain-containing protein
MERPAVSEREIKLAAPPTFHLPDLTDVIEGATVRALEPQRLQTVYVDTEDLRLARWGVSFRHRTGDGWTVKLPEGTRGALLVRGEYTFEGEDQTPPEAASDLVRAFARSGKLRNVVRLRTIRRTTLLESDDGTVLLEIDDDEVSVLAGSRIAARFREIEAEETQDSPKGLAEDVAERLRAAGAADGTKSSKYVQAIGPRALELPDVVVGKLPSKPRAGEVLRHGIAGAVAHLVRNDPVVRLDADIEGVHQTRVATRKLRSLLRIFAEYFDPAWASELRDELGWLGGVLGTNRDADVMLEHLERLTERLPDPERAKPIVEALALERETAHTAVLEAFRSERYVGLLDRLVDAATDPSFTPLGDFVAGSLAEPVQRQWRALRDRVKRNGSHPTEEELHRVRIHAKRARYAAEALEGVAGKRSRNFAAAAADLQTVLGDFNDAIVLRNWLLERLASTDDRDAAFAAGELAGLALAEAESSRKSWRKSWKALNALPAPSTW